MNDTQKGKGIEAWLSNIQELSEFHYYLHSEPWIHEEPGHSIDDYGDPLSPNCLTQFWKVDDYFPSKVMIFWISDIEGREMMLDIPLDGITGPSAHFFDKKRNIGIEVDLDLSIIDYILSLIERFPTKFFQDRQV